MKWWRCTSMLRGLRRARAPCVRVGRRPDGATAEDDYHHDREWDDDEREKLRGREHADRSSRIAAIKLDDEARHTVKEHVRPERTAGKGPAFLFRREQEDEDQQLGSRLVQLRRVERNVQRCSDVFRRIWIAEGDRPRDLGWA